VRQITVNPVLLSNSHAPHCALQIDANRRRTTKKSCGVTAEHAAAQHVEKSRHDVSRKLPIRRFQSSSVTPTTENQQRRHPRLVHPNADPVTGDTRLGHFEQTGPDPVAIANAHLVVGEAPDGEVFAELPKGEVASPERSCQ
jgi:hypothetical protein